VLELIGSHLAAATIGFLVCAVWSSIKVEQARDLAEKYLTKYRAGLKRILDLEIENNRLHHRERDPHTGKWRKR
jgi:hypothetical protein